ncbi:MAG: site-specific integrase [Bacteroidales bacterium]|nr:site-specific integrase [Bacteroidales bacterium]MDE7071777.1 site-specific integrase [Bacteroidales bacterium]
MPTFKILVRHFDRKTESGYYSVAIRMTHNRKMVFFSTPVQVSVKQVSKKGEITDPLMLVALNQRIMDMQAELLSLGVSVEHYSASELKDLLLRREEAKSRPLQQGINLLAFWREEFLPTVRHERTRKLYTTSMNRFALFVRKEDINTSHLSLKLVRDYEEWLRGEGVGARGVNLYLTHLKRVFNEAKMLKNDEDTGLIVIPNNPFSKYKVPLAPPAKKEGALCLEQLLAIIDHKPTTSREELSRDCFVMSLFLAGINSADLYNAVKLSKGWVLEFERTKTKTRRQDKALQRITVPEYMRPMFDKYRDRTGQRLLNFHIRYANENEFNRAINKGLKHIGEKVGIPGLYYYQARHSFASIAHNRLHYSLEDVGKCLCHVPLMRVTDGYVEPDYSIVDEVNQAVLRWVLEEK